MTLLEFQRPRPGQEVLGGNGPPIGELDGRSDIYGLAAAFLKDNPTVADEEAASAANEILVAAKSKLAALEEGRDSECDPLRDAWKAARARWASPIDAMAKVKDEVALRLSAYMRAEEDRRKAEAEQARLAAEALERAAREAERLEFEARQNASQGEFVDVVEASEAADQAFGQFKAAERVAHFAEKDSTIKLRSRFADKATVLRTKKKLVITDVEAALTAVGITEGITEAILTEARKFKKDFGKLPDGVSEVEERTL